MPDFKMGLNYPVFPFLTTKGGGFLPDEKGAHACWYFYTIAESARQAIGKGPSTQIILEGELWMDPQYEQQARSVAMLYGLNSPDDFQPFWPYVILQAKSMGYPVPADEYTRLCKPIIIQ